MNTLSIEEHHVSNATMKNAAKVTQKNAAKEAQTTFNRASKLHIRDHQIVNRRLRLAAAEARGAGDDPQLVRLAFRYEASQAIEREYWKTSSSMNFAEHAVATKKHEKNDVVLRKASLKLAKAIRNRGGTSAIVNGKIYILATTINERYYDCFSVLVSVDLARITIASPEVEQSLDDSEVGIAAAIRKAGGAGILANGTLFLLTNAVSDDYICFPENEIVLTLDMAGIV